jgi:DNA polymerase III epsilon subunit-like protein
MRISKYEFDSREQAETKINALGTATDENGNEYPTHKHSIVELGNIVLEQGEYDEEGEETTAPVLSDKWHLDVAWSDSDITTVEEEAVLDEEGMVVTPEVVSVNHPYGWKSYAVEIEGDGVHSFFGLSYESLKL